MTTPRDAIGLSERLRTKAAMITLGEKIAFGSETGLMLDAATQLDALSARVKELEAEAKDKEARYDSLIILTQENFARATRAEQERDEAKAGERESFQKYVDANEARIEAQQQRDEAVALLVRVNTLAQMPAWRRMPDGAPFNTTPLAGDINAAIRQLKIASGPDKEKRE